MRQLILFLSLILCSYLLFSCTKEKTTYATTGDQITKELQKVIANNSIKRVYPVKYDEAFPNSFPSQGGSWQFSNGFISINYGFDDTFNLAYLRYYSVTQVTLDDQSSSQALILYF